MNPNHRQRRTYVIVDVLRKVRLVVSLENRMNFYIKRFQASVASYCHSAVDAAFNIERALQIVNLANYCDIGRQNLLILKVLEEIGVGMPVNDTPPWLQAA